MAKKVLISQTRVDQFNRMVEMLRTIRTYDVSKQIAALKRDGYTKEEAQKMVIDVLLNIARISRGIAEIREVSHE